MAGQRTQPRPYIEVSAVCSHPDHHGKGYAGRLIKSQIRHIAAQSCTPFLHVRSDNNTAIKLYQKLGFDVRTEIHFQATDIEYGRTTRFVTPFGYPRTVSSRPNLSLQQQSTRIYLQLLRANLSRSPAPVTLRQTHLQRSGPTTTIHLDKRTTFPSWAVHLLSCQRPRSRTDA